MDQNYTHLKSVFNSTDLLMKYALSTKIWKTRGFGFEYTSVPNGLIQDEFYKTLTSKFNTTAIIARFKENAMVGWHKDAGRKAAINIELVSENSYTCYTSGKFDNIGFDLDKVEYQPNVPVLLNVENPHTVINLGSTRYALSIGIYEPEDYATDRDF